MRFRSRKEGSAYYWKPKNDQCVVSKDSKPNDKQYLFDRVFNETENNNIVYHGKELEAEIQKENQISVILIRRVKISYKSFYSFNLLFDRFVSLNIVLSNLCPKFWSDFFPTCV